MKHIYDFWWLDCLNHLDLTHADLCTFLELTWILSFILLWIKNMYIKDEAVFTLIRTIFIKMQGYLKCSYSVMDNCTNYLQVRIRTGTFFELDRNFEKLNILGNISYKCQNNKPFKGKEQEWLFQHVFSSSNVLPLMLIPQTKWC